ncbi:Thoeris anti-defense Tad2 family protein [Pseudooceanicola sp.]|uniref:Thoeris anti-defense Tad2 family protein n=1 Tax=Pseudooceanicola sp. TaxID=1914328 RepID=UPI004059DD0B
MNFGGALEHLKAGGRVARAGWNGKGMWIALMPGSQFDAMYAKPGHASHHRAKEMGEEVATEAITLLPHIDMRAADGSMVVGWLASQTDMLAEDWECLEETSDSKLSEEHRMSGYIGMVYHASPGALAKLAAEKTRIMEGEGFRVGDVVTLKSGGQPMTVLHAACCGEVEVGWHDIEGFREESFPRAVLMHRAEREDYGCAF